MENTSDTQVENLLDRTIEETINCYLMCQQTLIYCQETGGDYAAVDRLQILTDCASLCQMTADFLIRGSEKSAKACLFCAEVCDDCALSCASLEDSGQPDACAESCRNCAQICREFASLP